ncbi:MAG: glycosyltransferase [Burkholderiales bacterium]
MEPSLDLAGSDAIALLRRAGRPPSLLMVLEGVYPTDGGGGAETQVRTLSRYLAAQGVQVTVCAPMVHFDDAPSDTVVDGLPVIRIHYPRVPVLGALLMLAKLAWMLWRRRGEFDVLHAHIAGNMAAVACVMGRLTGKPVLVKLTGMTEMVGGMLDPRAPLAARLRRAAMRQATAVHAISSRIARALLHSGFAAQQVQQFPNAVDLPRFRLAGPAPAHRIDALAGVRLVGVYAGRFMPEKGVELLLRGWAACFAGRADVALLLLGQGPQEAELRALVQELGIVTQVKFLGPRDEVEQYLVQAHFGLLTSRAEGLSNTLLEYMASALPVVGSIVSGNEDFIVHGETGWLFPVDDLPAFTACLRELAETSPERLAAMGQAARQRVAERAALPAVAQRLLQIYGFVDAPAGAAART